MSAYYDVRGGPFLMLKSNVNAFFDLAQKVMGDYSDGFFDALPIHEPASPFTAFEARFNGEVGDTFTAKVHRFMAEVGVLLEQPVEVLIRQDTPDDDRDEYSVAGPTKVSIHLETYKGVMKRALKELSIVPLSHRTARFNDLMANLSSPETVAAHAAEKVPLHHYFEELDKGAILLACRLREDGDHDVMGSLNLDAISQEGDEYANWKLTAFLKSHADMDHFAKVHAVPDVLTSSENEANPAPAIQKPN